MAVSPVNDPVNNPKHYTSSPARCECGRQIECIQITEHMSFPVGSATKYLWRADLKDDPIEDLKKAAWYINREIARRQKGGYVSWKMPTLDDIRADIRPTEDDTRSVVLDEPGRE